MSGSSVFDQLQAEHLALDEVAGGEFPHPRRTRVIAVANQEGGVGEASAAVNLTVALVESGLHVLLINADSQDNASTALEVERGGGSASICDVFVDTMPIKDVVAKARFCESLWCVPATIDVIVAGMELISTAERELRPWRALVDYLVSCETDDLGPPGYVIVDCPPSLDITTINAFVAADGVLIPMQAEHCTFKGLALLTRSIDRVARIHNPGLGVSMIVLTMFDGRITLAREMESKVRSYFPDTALDTKVPRSVRVAGAPSFGAPVVFWDPRSTGAIAYKKMAHKVALRGAPRIEGEEA